MLNNTINQIIVGQALKQINEAAKEYFATATQTIIDNTKDLDDLCRAFYDDIHQLIHADDGDDNN